MTGVPDWLKRYEDDEVAKQVTGGEPLPTCPLTGGDCPADPVAAGCTHC